MINGTQAEGTCAPRSSQPIHIVAGTPHMHLKGRHMKVTVTRASGGTEVVHDEPFDFQNQRGYQENLTLQPGDSVVLVGNSDVFEETRKLFRVEPAKRKKVVIMGGPIMAVWLCRILRHRDWSIRVFERDRQLAMELAERLDWVTVLNADPTEQNDLSAARPDKVAELSALLAQHEEQMSLPIWPALIEGPIAIDHPLNVAPSESDEYVFWAN